MKLIINSKKHGRKEVLIDDEDYNKIKEYKWCVCRTRGKFAVIANGGINKIVSLHRLILDVPENRVVDHINHDTLDNRKENLRACSHAENMKNRIKQHNNKSGYKGVYWNKQNKRWSAFICIKGKNTFLGAFKDVIDASNCYNNYAKIFHGEFALLNDTLDNGAWCR